MNTKALHYKDKCIFLDFDETLGHSLYAKDEKQADQLLYTYTEHFFGDKFKMQHHGWHVTFKRPWADDLISFCKERVGEKNVYILSTGLQDYVLWCNSKLKLGIDPNTNIFGRETLRENQPHPMFTETFNVLVDNLYYRDHMYIGGKVGFLSKLPKKQYINVDEFTVWCEPIKKDVDYFITIKEKIEQLIKTEI